MAQTFDSALVEAFPPVDPGIKPFGSRILVQIRSAMGKPHLGLFSILAPRILNSGIRKSARLLILARWHSKTETRKTNGQRAVGADQVIMSVSGNMVATDGKCLRQGGKHCLPSLMTLTLSAR